METEVTLTIRMLEPNLDVHLLLEALNETLRQPKTRGMLVESKTRLVKSS